MLAENTGQVVAHLQALGCGLLTASPLPALFGRDWTHWPWLTLLMEPVSSSATCEPLLLHDSMAMSTSIKTDPSDDQPRVNIPKY